VKSESDVWYNPCLKKRLRKSQSLSSIEVKLLAISISLTEFSANSYQMTERNNLLGLSDVQFH